MYEMMQTEEVLVSSSNRDMLVYVSQTDERAFVFDWDEGLRIHIFVRSALINRYRLLTHFSFQDGLMPWSVSIDADSFRYNIDAGDARYIRYADITLTQAGRSRVFYATWVYAVVVLLSAAVTPGLTRGPLKIAERVSRV
ncbi:MAG: hypothetical protein FWB74_07375 [Defluviitaleaceae bacterium]|nr:hypothetical protein [Defluviitaleaceae bacterium]